MIRIVVVGASDHGRCVIDALDQAGEHEIVGVLDDAVALGTRVAGYDVLGTLSDVRQLRQRYSFVGGIVGIGDNYTRGQVVRRIRALDPEFEFVTAVHPRASVGHDVQVGEGVVLMAGSVIQGPAQLGKHSFALCGAVLSHDSTLGDFASLAPGAVAGGRVRVGDYAAIALGASVVHGVTIGEHTVVGAGSVVMKDLPSRVVAYGTPCRVVRLREPSDRYL